MKMNSAEKLSFSSGDFCEICNESVNYGDDYTVHLKEVHKAKNIARFQVRLRDRIKSKKKRKDVEIVDINLSDDDDECTLTEGPKAVDEEQALEQDNVYQCSDPALQGEIEKSLKISMDSLFKNVKGIINGTILVDNVIEAECNTGDAKLAERKLQEQFASLKHKIMSLELPAGLQGGIVESKRNRENMVVSNPSEPKKKPSKKDLKESNDVSAMVDKNSAFKKPITKLQNTNFEDKEKITKTKHLENEKLKTLAPSPVSLVPSRPPLTPIQSDRLGKSDGSNSSNGSARTLYLCPLKPCGYTAIRKEMNDGEAAKHLEKVHLGFKDPEFKHTKAGKLKINELFKNYQEKHGKKLKFEKLKQSKIF